VAVGLDISAVMVRHAERRCRCFAHVKIVKGPAHDLDAFPNSSFNLVLAADVFPYICEAGPELVQKTLSEIARVMDAAERLSY